MTGKAIRFLANSKYCDPERRPMKGNFYRFTKRSTRPNPESEFLRLLLARFVTFSNIDKNLYGKNP
jgi:hypothetical protein